MAREPQEERKLKILRGRIVVWLSAFVVFVVVMMYLIIQPFMASFGHPLDLPDGRVVFVLLAMAATGLALIDGKALTNVLSGVRITFGDPTGKKDGGIDG